MRLGFGVMVALTGLALALADSPTTNRNSGGHGGHHHGSEDFAAVAADAKEIQLHPVVPAGETKVSRVNEFLDMIWVFAVSYTIASFTAAEMLMVSSLTHATRHDTVFADTSRDVIPAGEVPDGIKFVTFSTKPNKLYNQFVLSASRHNASLTNIGEGKPWVSFLARIASSIEHLKTLPPEQIVVVTDGWDSLILHNQPWAAESFKRTGAKFLFGLDSHGSGHIRFIRYLVFGCVSDENGRFCANAGTLIGYAGSLVAYFQELLDLHSYEGDSFYMGDDMALINFNPQLIKKHGGALDSNDAFFCMWPCGSTRFENNTFATLPPGSAQRSMHPLVISFPGAMYDTDVINKLGYQVEFDVGKARWDRFSSRLTSYGIYHSPRLVLPVIFLIVTIILTIVKIVRLCCG